MSTPQHTTEHRDKTRTRQGAGALALSALITLAIGALILHTGHRTTTPPTASIAHPALSAAAVTTQASGVGDCLVNPYNQARACYQAAQAPIATPAPSGYYRDPATHKLLRIPVAHNRIHRPPPNRPSSGVAP